MSWSGWLVVLAALYVLVLVIRGVVQFITWATEEFLGVRTPRAARRPHFRDTNRSEEATSRAARENAAANRKDRRDGEHDIPAPRGCVVRPRKPSAFSRLMKFLCSRRSYDFWVACALSEDEPGKKIEYLSRALKLNPEYLPAWGLKGNALFALEKHEGAMECFSRSLAIRSSALMWHKKGLCCHRLNRLDEAIECFDRAVQEAGKHDRQLSEEAIRMRKLVEQERRNKGAA